MCVLVFQIGDFVYLIEGTGELPLPLELPALDSLNVLHVTNTSEGTVNRREKSKTEQIDIFRKYSFIYIDFS